MSDAPTTSNTAAQAVDGVLKALINDVVIAAAKAAAVTEVPWLAWPVVSQLFDALLNWIGGYVYTAMADWTTIGVIDVQAWTENADYQNQLDLLKVASAQAVQRIQAASQVGDQNAIAETKTKFKNAFQKLVHWDGSATP